MSQLNAVFRARALFRVAAWPGFSQQTRPVSGACLHTCQTFDLLATEHLWRRSCLDVENAFKAHIIQRRWKRSSSKRAPAVTSAESTGDTTDWARWLHEAEAQVRSTHTALQRDLDSIRTGRADPGLLDSVIVVLSDGSRVPLRKLAHVSLRDPRTLQVLVHDASWAGNCEKAIRSAGLGLNPVAGTGNASHALFVPVPPPSVDARRQMIRLASQRAEEARKAIRLVRRDLLEQIKSHVIREDDRFALREKVEVEVQRWVRAVDQVLHAKVRELEHH
ncbi:mitochondrial ribosome releasing factor RRF [Cyanidioschyzon merolae strain 10D]|jgi:ribosome recycling factor|uniref:Mitochondrial ribosome releasing factor RRF n=1 Tax=Cyanidioschyzon merolae (strain NIES-3377 / 10D) TaxID=280699 RepID=M1UXV7_CYAM1|nr:mitochondrial ribosome releasing factor RRF [Cyanidioschyzon merolae strain 10D]BAM83361.1 mitochondrial ribosome releasing factor RRF [Cyanidioschyzon merolae strain 10D]|eukprot:XP_005539397.1 mitochondrial ribosome releasing factor RRF [Cyanidioschyzon merolae strain 10D]